MLKINILMDWNPQARREKPENRILGKSRLIHPESYNLSLSVTLIPAYLQLFPHSYTGYPQLNRVFPHKLLF